MAPDSGCPSPGGASWLARPEAVVCAHNRCMGALVQVARSFARHTRAQVDVWLGPQKLCPLAPAPLCRYAPPVRMPSAPAGTLARRHHSLAVFPGLSRRLSGLARARTRKPRLCGVCVPPAPRARVRLDEPQQWGQTFTIGRHKMNSLCRRPAECTARARLHAHTPNQWTATVLGRRQTLVSARS